VRIQSWWCSDKWMMVVAGVAHIELIKFNRIVF